MQEGAVLSFIAVNGDNQYKWKNTIDTPIPTYRKELAQTIPILCPGIQKKEVAPKHLGKSGSLSLTVVPTPNWLFYYFHPLYDSLCERYTIIRLYKPPSMLYNKRPKGESSWEHAAPPEP